jgi:NAD-dependent DNA ligase
MQKPAYIHYVNKMNFDKEAHILEGILKGIAIDSIINEDEANALARWYKQHIQYQHRHPFNEILPVIDIILNNSMITIEDKDDILWLLNNYKTDNVYYDSLTSDIQRLHGLLHGILADGILSDIEIKNLYKWVSENEHLKGCFPFDEIDSLLTTILTDGKIDNEEREILKAFFKDLTISSGLSNEIYGTQHLSISGVCASCPDIMFDNKSFCITGESNKATRNEIVCKIKNVGGTIIGNVRENLNYLIVCSAGNQCWAFSCYGRKIEKAVNYRKNGARIIIVHENDLWDALADAG